ncbi:hypothetical protein BH20CHL4_BH20CHL4_08060 [soil metagenome]
MSVARTRLSEWWNRIETPSDWLCFVRLLLAAVLKLIAFLGNRRRFWAPGKSYCLTACCALLNLVRYRRSLVAAPGPRVGTGRTDLDVGFGHHRLSTAVDR